MTTKIKIPVYQPNLKGREEELVMDCISSSWISGKGKYINEFEEKFADYVGVKYATTVCNGTVALHLALVALGIGPGDEVIVPTLTYIAPVNAVTYTGATPVFVDSNANDWQISPQDVKKKITERTKAILCVHLYGHPCDLKTLKEISQEHDLFLIEDCAEATGSFFEDRHVGTYGDVSTFSFYGNKTITTGEGGMVITNDETLFDRLKHFKGQGLAQHRQYWHDVVGYNYRMTNICAAIGLAQLERIDDILEKKRRVAQAYAAGLSNTPYEFHQECGASVHSYWMCSFLVPEPDQRDLMRDYLAEQGIETRPVFYPVHTMPMYSHQYERHRVAENIGWRGINLPSYPDLKEEEIYHILETIKSF